MMEMSQANFDKYFGKIIELAITYAPKLILALAVFFIGMWLIKGVMTAFKKLMEKQKVDNSLSDFLISLSSIILKLVLLLAVIDMIGIQTTSFLAVLGAAGLAIGLALQGSLANFAGGVLILLFRPFKVGDYIISQGEEGTVQKIDIFNTWLNKLDNRRVILPNGPLGSGTIINVTAEDIRRVDIPIGVSYSASNKKVKSTLLELGSRDDRVLKDPEPFVGLTDFGDSSVNYTLRIWCKCEDYWGVFFDTNEALKESFDENKIEIPFPQRDIHLYKHD